MVTSKVRKCQKIKPQSRRAFVKEQKEKLLTKWLEKVWTRYFQLDNKICILERPVI